MTAVAPDGKSAADSRKRLPDGWRWVRLAEKCRLINGDAYRESDWATSGSPIIRIQNLNDATKPFNYWAGPLRGRVNVNPGDVLLAWSGTPGTSFGAHIWKRGSGVLNQHIFRIDFSGGDVLPEWAVIAINYQLDVLIRKAHGGVGLRHVTKGEVESLEIPLPSVPEQQRIAAILNEQMAAVERARAAAEARLEAAKGLPAACLRGLFNSAATGSWPRRKLGEVCQLLPSKSIATDGNTEVQAITTACLTETGFAPAGVKSARMWAGDASESAVSPGEVLVARSNTPDLVGRAAMYSGEPSGVVATDLTIRIWPSRDVTSQFLALYLSFLYLTGYWKARAGGASGSMKKITREQIQGEEIPVPPFGEQEGVAHLLNGQLADSEHIRKTIEEECGAINALPAALLRRAFTGEI